MITGHGARVIKLYDPVITVLSIAVLSITVLSIVDQLGPLSSLKVTANCFRIRKVDQPDRKYLYLQTQPTLI